MMRRRPVSPAPRGAPLRIVSTPELHHELRSLLGESLSWERWTRVARLPRDATRFEELVGIEADAPTRVLAFVPYGAIRPVDLPGPVAGHALVSYVFYRTHDDVARWWRRLQRAPDQVPDRALVLAMMKPLYLEWAERVRIALAAHRFTGSRLRCHLPHETLHTELGEILSRGCTLAIYVGHGRSRGWSGYRGFRWKHVAPHPQLAPVGTMISLSCSSLAQDKEHSLPMGLQWVASGRCGAFLGACDAVEIEPLKAVTRHMLDILAGAESLDVGDLVQAVDHRVRSSGCAEVGRCWQSFRLIGNPYQALQAAAGARLQNHPLPATCPAATAR